MAPGYRGRFDCKVDEKGRLSLPSLLRQQLVKSSAPASAKKSSKQTSKSKATQEFVVTNSLVAGKNCLDIYPLKEWQKLEASIAKMPQLKQEVQVYKRFYLASGQVLQLDGQSRMLIPASLRKYAGLDEAVVLVGMGNKFELWSQPLWQGMYSNMSEQFENVLGAIADLEVAI